ncbi:MAG TPA: glycosyltransferase family 2 protein [Myxococcota bacterium]|nr:glycosyltransferase family 2 protein [Myxococcota bacterium]
MAVRCAVVIPSFEHARFVGAALDSALSQTRPPARVVVVDDGSRDETPAIVARYEARGVELHVQPNAGAHAALNRACALAATDCDVVAILNSDDVYEPRRLERCLDELASRPDAGVVCTALSVIDDEGRPLPADAPRRRWFDVAWSLGAAGDLTLPEWLGQVNFPATSSNVVARASDLRAQPFRPYRYCHDYAFLLESALRGRLAIVSEPLLRYRVHGANTMVMDPAPLVRELLRLHADLYRALAPDLRADPALRERLRAFARASFDNASSLHAGLFQTLVAELLAAVPDERVAAALAELETAGLAELREPPNASLQKEDLRAGRAVSRSELLERNARLELAARELARLRRHVQGSRWVRLGAALGVKSARRLLEGAAGADGSRADAARARPDAGPARSKASPARSGAS